MSFVRITFEEIAGVWSNKLWTQRTSAIEPTSAIGPDGSIDMSWHTSTPEFWKSADSRVYGSLLILGRQARLRGLWVEPSARGSGLGRAMIEHLYARALSNNCSEVWTMARHDAADFYERCGLVRGREISGYEHGPHVLMSRPLKPD